MPEPLRIIAEALARPVTPETILVQFDALCIACALDEEFGTELPDAVVDRWVSVQDVLDTVEGTRV